MRVHSLLANKRGLLMNDSLLVKLQARDPAAQQEFRAIAFSKLLSICMQVMKDASAAADLAEDIWMDFLYQHVDKVRQEHAMAAYLRVIAVRRCARVKRWQQFHEELEQHGELADTEGSDLLSMLEQHRRLKQLGLCLKKLSEKAQGMLHLRFKNEMTTEAIGVALGVSRQYTSRMLDKSLQQLRRCMGG
jgi:RNA polymerase sigma factor (sigma-70 family)